MYRAVIIDDEDASRGTLRDYILKANGPFTIVGEAKDGVSGLKLVRNLTPDVIFLDICMPGMDGLTLLKTLREESISCKAVMLTAYSDFNYARLSVELHAFDYLLKPIHQDQLKRLLKKLAAALDEDRQAFSEQRSLKLAAERNIAAYQNTVLSRFLKKDGDEALLREAQSILQWQGSFLVAAYSLDKNAGHSVLEAMRSLGNRNKGPFDHVLYVCVTDGLFASIHYFPTRSGSQSLWDAYFELFSHQLSGACGLICPVVGLSDVHSDIGEMQAAYSEAVAAVSSQFSLASKPVIHFAECRRFQSSCDYPQEQEAKILSALFYGNSTNVLLYANHFFSDLLDRDLNTALLKQMCMHLGLAVLKKIKTHPQFSKFSLPEEAAFFDIARYRTVHDFKLFLTEQLCAIAGQIDQEKRNLSNQKFVAEVQSYLQEHLSEDIALADIAGSFGLTPSYFSALFKKEFQENFVEYFTKRKLSYANQLLRDPKRSISEISRMIGYNDPRYFFKVYKKYEGISPGEYRKQAHMQFAEDTLSESPDS